MEQKDPQEIESFLDLIYEKISDAANNGECHVEVKVKPCAERHKYKILQILKEDGYRAKIEFNTNWLDDYDEYVRVSW